MPRLLPGFPKIKGLAQTLVGRAPLAERLIGSVGMYYACRISSWVDDAILRVGFRPGPSGSRNVIVIFVVDVPKTTLTSYHCYCIAFFSL